MGKQFSGRKNSDGRKSRFGYVKNPEPRFRTCGSNEFCIQCGKTTDANWGNNSFILDEAIHNEVNVQGR